MLLGVVSQTPTEPASPRTLARARARGDFPYASELPLAVALLALVGLGAQPLLSLERGFRSFAQLAFRGQLTSTTALDQLYGLSTWLMLVLAAPTCAALVMMAAQRAPTLRWGAGGGAAQRERVATGRRALPRPVQALLATLKLVTLCIGLGAVLYESWPGLLAAYERSAPELLSIATRVLRALLLRAGLLLVLLGAIELLVQQVDRLQRLRMTRRQLQQEQRELAGDPRLLAERSARRQDRSGEISRLPPQLRTQAISQLSAAAVLITGADRVVALRYDRQRDAAPWLWLSAEGAHAVELLQRAYALQLSIATDASLVAELSRLSPPSPLPSSLHARVAQLMVSADVPAAREVS